MADALQRAEPAAPAGAAETAGRPGDAPPAAPSYPGADARRWSNTHPINIRLSIPVPGLGRWYLTVVGGRERRSADRLVEERRKHPLLTYGNVVFFFAIGTVVGLASLTLLHVAAIWVLEQHGALVAP